MTAAQNNGPGAANYRPAKERLKYATDFIASCARYARWDAAVICAAALMAAEFVRRVVAYA
jgi:hypothetical protein